MERNQKRFSIFIKTIMYLFSLISFAFLIGIVGYIVVRGVTNIKPELFELKYTAKNQSMIPSIFNTLLMILMVLIISLPIGIFSAIYMVEYAKAGNRFVKVVRLATETLQGIPSIIFGLFGYLFFNSSLGGLGLGYSIISGALTLSIMVLPLIIRSTEEALISIDNSLREASYGLGAKKLRTVFNVVLPPAMNGILSGVILAIGRIFGETAALLYTSGIIGRFASPKKSGSTLAVHMYKLSSEGRFFEEAFVVAFVLLVFVIIINTLSTYIGQRLGGKNI